MTHKVLPIYTAYRCGTPSSLRLRPPGTSLVIAGNLVGGTMTAEGSPYLKAQNQWQLALFLVLNACAAAAVALHSDPRLPRAAGWLLSNWKSLAVVAVAALLISVLNAVVSPGFKASLVFWRWHNPLPGHRAFTQYLRADPRIDPNRLRARIGAFPEDAVEQNRLWYRIYRAHQGDSSVSGSHKDYLLTRDLTWLSFGLLVALGLPAIVLGTGTLQRVLYPAFLIVQVALTSLSARRNGIRLVCNAIAIEASLEATQASRILVQDS